MKNTVLIMVMLLAAGGCQQYQLQSVDYWVIASQSYQSTGQVVIALIDAGEIDRDAALEIKKYNEIAKLALDQWYESIVADESAAAAIGRFNQAMAGFLAVQRKEK